MAITNQIRFDNLRGDIFGGVTAAIVSLPLALAFGVASGAGPIAGLYGAVCVGFFAALFGGTPTLISEPTGPMTVVMTAMLAIENAIRDAHDKGLEIYIVEASTKIKSRLDSLGLFNMVTAEHILDNRTEALRESVDHAYSKGVTAWVNEA